MNTIPIGVPTAILQDVVWAIPPVSCEIQTTAALQSAITDSGSFAAFTSGIVTGCFVKCTTGNATVTLRKNAVG